MTATWTQDAHDAQASGRTPIQPTGQPTLLFQVNAANGSGAFDSTSHFMDTPRYAQRVCSQNRVLIASGLAPDQTSGEPLNFSQYALYAYNLTTFALDWHWPSAANTSGSYQSVEATPAVDETTGSVLVPSAVDGLLYKIRETDGVVLASYDAGSPIKRAVIMPNSTQAVIVTSAGDCAAIDIATMTLASGWSTRYVAGSAATTPPRYSPKTGLIYYGTADLNVHAVRLSDGTTGWAAPVNPTDNGSGGHLSGATLDSAGRSRYTYEGATPFIADEPGVLLIKFRSIDDQNGQGFASTLARDGLELSTPGTNAEIRTYLNSHPTERTVFALKLADGTKAFDVNAVWTSQEGVGTPPGSSVVGDITNVGTTVTVTTGPSGAPIAHGRLTGQSATLSGVAGFADNTLVNGTHLITAVPTSTTYRFTATSAPSGTYTPNSGNLAHTAYGVIGGSPVAWTLNGHKVALLQSRSWASQPAHSTDSTADGRWSGLLAILILDNTTLPGYSAGDFLWVQFAIKYANTRTDPSYCGDDMHMQIADEAGQPVVFGTQGPGDLVVNTGWDAITARTMGARTTTQGDTYDNPLPTTAQWVFVYGINAAGAGSQNNTTHKLTSGNVGTKEEDSSSRTTNPASSSRPAYWGGWNMPRPPSSGGPPNSPTPHGLGWYLNTTAGSFGKRPNGVLATQRADGQVLLIVGGNGGDVSVFTTAATLPGATVLGPTTPVATSVPVYGAFEATFPITGSPATNLQKPYDASAPAGITNNGISVDAQFLPPGVFDWSQAITHPCRYRVPYTLAVIGGQQQGLPTLGQSAAWRVRWAAKNPAQTGTWTWRRRVVDSSGTYYSDAETFTVTSPTTKGFVKVSATEPSRFEYTDGSSFAFIGTNGDNTATLDPKYTNVGHDIHRVWFSNFLPLGTGVGDNTNAPWSARNTSGNFFAPASAGGPAPFSLHFVGGAHASGVLSFVKNSASLQAFPSARRNTPYRFSFWAKTAGLSGTGKITLKLAPFSTSTTIDTVLASPVATLVTTTPGSAPTVWTQYTASYSTGLTDDFFGGNPNLNYVYVVLENSTTGSAEVAGLSCQEDLGGGNFGPNQWDLANGTLDTYSQMASAMIESLVLDAASKGITLKAVIEDKGETAWKYLNATGTTAVNANGDLRNITAMTMSGSTVTVTIDGTTSGLLAGVTWISLIGSSFGFNGQWKVATVTDGTHFTFTSTASGQTASPLGTVSVSNFYNSLASSQTGWYHKAYARYLCALVGYSPAIHSWEHINEGDGGAAQQAFTDEWAAYLHQIDVHGHPVTTSTAIGVHTAFWAGMSNPDYADYHGYRDTGDLGTYDWDLPLGSWTWVSDPTSPGAIQMDASTVQSWFLPFACQEAGTWMVSCDVNTQSVTGGTFGFSGEGMSQLVAGGQNWTTITGTFNRATAAEYDANLLLGAGTHTGGTGKIRNLAIVSPSGKRLYMLLGDGLFPPQTDLSRDTAAFRLAYKRYASGNRGFPNGAGQGVYGKPMVCGEWAPGTAVSPANTYETWVTGDTNLVWLHCALWAQLGPGALGDLPWNLNTNPIDTFNGWGKFKPFRDFVDLLPLNNGHYQDIAATASVATIRAVGQRDLTNNRAHLWVSDTSFTGRNVSVGATVLQPSGTVTVPGLANGSYTADITWFDVTGAPSTVSQTLTSSGGSLIVDAGALSAAHPTMTDFAIQLTPVGGAPPTLYALVRAG